MGIDVVTTRDIHQSIWYMIAMHGYLSKEHYPKHKKYFSVQEQAIGMLTAIPTIGEARAKKALQKMSIRAMAGCTHIDGLTEKQSGKLQDVMRYRI
jgi:ERCC4-type nuclease